MSDDPRDDERIALRRLSRPAGGPDGMPRREFLRLLGIGAGVTAGAAVAPDLVRNLRAFAAAPVGPTEGILVLIMMNGGNDGLNTLVPFGDSRYYQLRPRVGIPAANLLRLNGAYGLHPALARIKGLYDQGKVGVVQGVGYTPPDLSHFTSMGIWMNGWAGGAQPGGPTGWIGRYLDGLPNAETEALHGVVIGDSVPLHMQGSVARASGLPMSLGSAFGLDRREPSDARMFDAVASFGSAPSGLGQWGDLLGEVGRQTMDLSMRLQPAYTGTQPSGHLPRQLALVARLINTNLGIRVFSTEYGGFDTHDDQPGDHANLLSQLDTAVDTFFATLSPTWRTRVTLMTFSEFGRRAYDNDGNGTDHGTSSVSFVIGDRVKGGLHGATPSLASVDRHGNLPYTVDFRQLYATVLDKWLRADSREVLGYSFPSLDLFQSSGPGGGQQAPPTVEPTRRLRRRLTTA